VPRATLCPSQRSEKTPQVPRDQKKKKKNKKTPKKRKKKQKNKNKTPKKKPKKTRTNKKKKKIPNKKRIDFRQNKEVESHCRRIVRGEKMSRNYIPILGRKKKSRKDEYFRGKGGQN